MILATTGNLATLRESQDLLDWDGVEGRCVYTVQLAPGMGRASQLFEKRFGRLIFAGNHPKRLIFGGEPSEAAYLRGEPSEAAYLRR